MSSFDRIDTVAIGTESIINQGRMISQNFYFDMKEGQGNIKMLSFVICTKLTN